MLIVGADENGLGPRLGPLVATAASIEVRRYDAKKLQKLAAKVGVGDSKQTSAFGRMARAESLTLALIEAEHGQEATSYDALLERMSLRGPLGLRSLCPGGETEKQCWSKDVELPAFGGDIEVGRSMLAGLRKGGVRVRRVRTTLACAGMINAQKAKGHSKLKVDLALFEDLLLDARASLGEDVIAHCGMVGGIRDYPRYFGRLRGASALKERCAYAIPSLGEVRFEVKADDRHIAVSLASMVGKVVRELAMRRIVRFYQAHQDDLPDVSGYHDPVTAGFVRKSSRLRRRLSIVASCYER